MPTVVYHLPDGSRSAVEVPAGQSVMDGSVRNNLPGIVAECGGSCSCATCHVFLDQEAAERFDEASMEEQDLLEFLDGASSRSRLACQLIMRADMGTVNVTVAQSEG
ncbi:2Fe-2S iron-sulfur cluster-binding protein [Nocardia sp. NPDC004860]|uniref:2Fe-2S iron-sulfur cluster-binding protein n=1 Tax=Nocardia sp. NPDC004860 TaxID=3154557 RepID=UPI0033A42804